MCAKCFNVGGGLVCDGSEAQPKIKRCCLLTFRSNAYEAEVGAGFMQKPLNQSRANSGAPVSSLYVQVTKPANSVLFGTCLSG